MAKRKAEDDDASSSSSSSSSSLSSESDDDGRRAKKEKKELKKKKEAKKEAKKDAKKEKKQEKKEKKKAKKEKKKEKKRGREVALLAALVKPAEATAIAAPAPTPGPSSALPRPEQRGGIVDDNILHAMCLPTHWQASDICRHFVGCGIPRKPAFPFHASPDDSRGSQRGTTKYTKKRKTRACPPKTVSLQGVSAVHFVLDSGNMRNGAAYIEFATNSGAPRRQPFRPRFKIPLMCESVS